MATILVIKAHLSGCLSAASTFLLKLEPVAPGVERSAAECQICLVGADDGQRTRSVGRDVKRVCWPQPWLNESAMP